MNTLPPEIVVHILQRTDPKTVATMRLVSRRYNIIFKKNQCRLPKPKVKIQIEFSEELIQIEAVIRFHLIGLIVIKGRGSKKSPYDLRIVDDFDLPYMLSGETHQHTWEIRSTNVFEDLLRLFETFDKHLSIEELTLKGCVLDATLTYLNAALKRNSCVDLHLEKCDLRVTNTELWTRFLAKLQPREIEFWDTNIFTCPLFTKEMLDSAMVNTRKVTFLCQNEFNFGSTDGGLAHLFLLKTCANIYIPHRDAIILLSFATIRMKIDEWLKGESLLVKVQVSFSSAEYMKVAKYFDKCEGPESSNSDFLTKLLTNVKGESLIFMVNKTKFTIMLAR